MQEGGSVAAAEQPSLNVAAGAHDVLSMNPHMKSTKGAVSCATNTTTPRPLLAWSSIITNTWDSRERRESRCFCLVVENRRFWKATSKFLASQIVLETGSQMYDPTIGSCSIKYVLDVTSSLYLRN